MTRAPGGKILVTRMKFKLAMPASISARSKALSSVRPSPAPATRLTAFGKSHMAASPSTLPIIP